MTKITKSKSKVLRSAPKKPERKALKAKRAAPKSEQSRSRQRNTAATRGSKHQQTALTPKPASAAGAERVTRRFPRPFLLPFAVMDMWFRAVEPKRDSK